MKDKRPHSARCIEHLNELVSYMDKATVAEYKLADKCLRCGNEKSLVLSYWVGHIDYCRECYNNASRVIGK